MKERHTYAQTPNPHNHRIVTHRWKCLADLQASLSTRQTPQPVCTAVHLYSTPPDYGIERAHLLHRSPWRAALVEDARGVVPVGEVLGDLSQRGEHADASVLELRGAVPLHLLGGAVLAEAERVEDAAGLDVEAHEPVHRVSGDRARRRRLALAALLCRRLEAVWFSAAVKVVFFLRMSS